MHKMSNSEAHGYALQKVSVFAFSKESVLRKRLSKTISSTCLKKSWAIYIQSPEINLIGLMHPF